MVVVLPGSLISYLWTMRIDGVGGAPIVEKALGRDPGVAGSGPVPWTDHVSCASCVAALALRGGQPARALQLVAAVDGVRGTAGAQIWLDIAPRQQLWARMSWEDIRAAAEQALPPGAAAAWTAGQALSLEQVIAEALDWLAPPQT